MYPQENVSTLKNTGQVNIFISYAVLYRCLYNVADRRKLRNLKISRIDGDEISLAKQFLDPVRLLLNLGVEGSITVFTKDENVLQVYTKHSNIATFFLFHFIQFKAFKNLKKNISNLIEVSSSLLYLIQGGLHLSSL